MAYLELEGRDSALRFATRQMLPRRLRMRKTFPALCALLAVISCADGGESEVEQSAVQTVPYVPYVANIVVRGMSFESPAEIRPGWTTFQLINESPLAHFAVIERLPEGKTIDDSEREVFPVFQAGMDLINQGQTSAGFVEFERLPAWFGDIVFLGGPGFVSGGEMARTTVHLEPGTYVIECYVKTGGRFHSVDGMASQLVVTGPPSEALEPDADITLTLSNDGITVDGSPIAGRQFVRVEFAEQMLHEHLLGHDVHLVRMEDTEAEDVAAWMNWIDVTALQTPAPATFLGGVHEMPAGSTAYLEVILAPGQYAWVAEVPNAIEKGMLVDFTVPAASAE